MPTYKIDHDIILEIQKISKLIIVCNEKSKEGLTTSSSYHDAFEYGTKLCWNIEDLKKELILPNYGNSYIIFYLNGNYALVGHQESIRMFNGGSISAILNQSYFIDDVKKSIFRHLKNDEENLVSMEINFDPDDFLKHNPNFTYHLDILQLIGKQKNA